MNKKEIPVIFIHKGFPAYLKKTVACARENQNRVIVLGNDENRKIQTDKWLAMSEFPSTYFKTFKKNYIHRSSNPVWFELVCFERYFILLSFLKKQNIKECFMLDSDVLLFDKITALPVDFIDAGGCSETFTVNPCILYWTVSALEDFVLFCVEQYQNRDKWLALNRRYAGMVKEENHAELNLCDMVLLKLWTESTACRWKNFFDESAAYIIDGNLNAAKCSETSAAVYKIKKELSIKKYTFMDQVPFITDTNGKKSRVLAVHCQGTAKTFISSLYARQDFS